MSYLYLDIETIPCQDECIRRDLVSEANPPANYKKPEAIENWRKENAKDIIGKTSFNGGLGRICQICAVMNEATVTLSLGPDTANERDVLKRFDEFLENTQQAHGYAVPVIVGHNVNNFDIRFLWQRAICLGVKLPSWFPKDPKAWGQETFDTMTAWAGARGTVSLDNLAKYLGIHGKQGVDGSMVAQMWTDGKHKEIADYCMNDVLLVKQIHEQMMKVGL